MAVYDMPEDGTNLALLYQRRQPIHVLKQDVSSPDNDNLALAYSVSGKVRYYMERRLWRFR